MVSKDAEKKIEQLQLYEQSLQNFLAQRQQFQIQLIEIESALRELEKTDKAYKLVGNIMVSSKKDDFLIIFSTISGIVIIKMLKF